MTPRIFSLLDVQLENQIITIKDRKSSPQCLSGNTLANSMCQPCLGHFSGCTFLDGDNIIYPYSITGNDDGVTRLRVVTLPSTPNSTPLCFYDFALDFLAFHEPHVYLTHYLCVNTLPSNPSSSCFPGLFHVDPRGKILVLLAHTLGAGSMPHVPHDTFLSYIATHLAEYNTVVVPWVEWGPGNSHLIGAPNMLLDRYSRQTACGMYALTVPPMIRSPGERKHYVLRMITRNASPTSCLNKICIFQAQ
jgi:hypothetical protein